MRAGAVRAGRQQSQALASGGRCSKRRTATPKQAALDRSINQSINYNYILSQLEARTHQWRSVQRAQGGPAVMLVHPLPVSHWSQVPAAPHDRQPSGHLPHSRVELSRKWLHRKVVVVGSGGVWLEEVWGRGLRAGRHADGCASGAPCPCHALAQKFGASGWAGRAQGQALHGRGWGPAALPAPE